MQEFVSRNVPLPAYAQLKNILKARVESGFYGPTLPSEAELARQYHVSKHTVRRALLELEKEGTIIKRRGKVAVTVKGENFFREYARELLSFTEEMRRKGLVPSSKVLRFEKILPDSEVCKMLNLKEGEEVVVLERVRYGSGEPFNIGTSFLPYKMVPDIFSFDFGEESLHHVLRTYYGIELVMADESFEPAMPTPAEAQLLHIPRSMPILLMKGVIYSIEGTPVEYFHLKFRGDKARFSVRVFRKS
ncbi:MAG: GntR family transcriptional regulator [Candidatus Caldatribacterium sp.]|nr:GntR family transcriptional regulator [Candidatus Caldatribacterium sp.]